MSVLSMIPYLLYLLSALFSILLFFRKTYIFASIANTLCLTGIGIFGIVLVFYDVRHNPDTFGSVVFAVIEAVALLLGCLFALVAVLRGARPEWMLWAFVACMALAVCFKFLPLLYGYNLISHVTMFCWGSALCFLSPLCRLRRHPRRGAGAEVSHPSKEALSTVAGNAPVASAHVSAASAGVPAEPSRDRASEPDISAEDEKLLRRYHRVVVRDLVAQLVVFSIFLLAILTPSLPLPENALFILLGVGCVVALCVRRLLPSGEPARIAKEMKKRKQTFRDTQTNPYYYLYRALAASDIPKRSPAMEKTMIIVTAVLKVINALLYLMTALLCVVFSLMIMVVVGGISWIFYVVARGGRANASASFSLRCMSLSKIPLLFSLAFLRTTLCFADVRSAPTGKTLDTAMKAFETDPKRMGRELSELEIDSYLSVNGIVLPGGCTWDGVPSLSASGSNVYLTGRICISEHVKGVERDQLLNKCTDLVKDQLGEQAKRFLEDYPNAPRATVEVSLNAVI